MRFLLSVLFLLSAVNYAFGEDFIIKKRILPDKFGATPQFNQQSSIIKINNNEEIQEEIKPKIYADFFPYTNSVSKKIEKIWANASARMVKNKGSEEYKIKTSFTIQKDGSVQDIKIIESTGDSKDEQIAVWAIRSSAPFDKLPDEFMRDKLEFEFTFKHESMFGRMNTAHLKSIGGLNLHRSFQ